LEGEVKTKLALHIEKLQAAGFVKRRKIVHKLAFDVAIYFGVKTKCNAEKQSTGTHLSRRAILAFPSGKQKASASLLLEPKV
jgi:hypothetical protein